VLGQVKGFGAVGVGFVGFDAVGDDGVGCDMLGDVLVRLFVCGRGGYEVLEGGREWGEY